MKLKNKRFNYSIFCLPKYEKPPATQIKFFCDALFLSHKISFAKISFIFCDDEYLSKLKLEYFNKNELTDVISFLLSENKSSDLEGEVYISLDRALENSISYSQDYNKEVMRLIIHGCLHLIGFDDETEDEKEKMTLMEDKFLGLKKW
tara:strand:- start:18 stop:461 length:444 start_codon:yes stop_codon:yes gene_type:complete